jgi:2-dehydro-3-deoxyphosphogluconate aldolase / (4S)-4-hydroxy-2-oxoglutarate aldolase
MSVIDVVRAARVVPVIVLDKAEDAVPLARTFLEAGIGTIEITLRTKAGLEAIKRTIAEVPKIAVGAGTVTTLAELRAVKQAGVSYVVSPGCTPALLNEAKALGVDYLPGVVTPSELMMAADAGLSCLKFFPAEPSGGAVMLKAWSSVFPHIAIVPTGGIDIKNAADYFAVPTVAAVGCSWVAPAKLIADANWAEIKSRCAQILALANK